MPTMREEQSKEDQHSYLELQKMRIFRIKRKGKGIKSIK